MEKAASNSYFQLHCHNMPIPKISKQQNGAKEFEIVDCDSFLQMRPRYLKQRTRKREKIYNTCKQGENDIHQGNCIQHVVWRLHEYVTQSSLWHRHRHIWHWSNIKSCDRKIKEGIDTNRIKVQESVQHAHGRYSSSYIQDEYGSQDDISRYRN